MFGICTTPPPSSTADHSIGYGVYTVRRANTVREIPLRHVAKFFRKQLDYFRQLFPELLRA